MNSLLQPKPAGTTVHGPITGTDAPFAITFFTGHAAGTRRQEAHTLHSLAKLVAKTTATSKAELPWLKLAKFGDIRTDKGSLRHDGNVQVVTGLEADYDGGLVNVPGAIETLTKAGVLSLVYTSPSHTDEAPRWRVLCPTSESIVPARREKLMGRLNGLFGGIFAGESWTLSQAYYFGSVASNPSHQVEVIDGMPIDLLDELDEIWRGKPNTAPAKSGQAQKSGPLDEAALINEITSGNSYHASAVRLLGKWALQDIPFLDARARLVAAFDGVFPPDRDARWKSRRDDVDRCLMDIYGKEAVSKDQQHDSETGEIKNDNIVIDKPLIVVRAGELDVLATKGEGALSISGLPVFQRGDVLVRPISREVSASRGRTTVAAGLTELSSHAMLDLLSQSATWMHFNKRAKQNVACDPPGAVPAIILSRKGQWKLRPVAGVITTPTLRPDGSILSQPGYDTATRLYHVADPSLELGSMPKKPTRANAEEALETLRALLTGFPFVTEVDRAVALSGLITPVVRGALSVVPLHGFRASTAGTGKSYLVDIASAIATGRPCPVVAAGQTDEETEKRLVGLLIAGFPIVSVDNVNGELGGDLMCQLIERPLIRVRPLGRSEIMELESRATVFATGNGLRVRGDMTRRSLISSLDAKMERPELRKFSTDPVKDVLSDRGKYVAACLTIVRAYAEAGRPDRLQPIASFEDWSDSVRSALIWLGCADPVTSMEAARDDDPDLAELRELLSHWATRLGSGIGFSFAVRDVAEEASKRAPTKMGEPTDFEHPEFRDVLLRIAGDRGGINTKKLGRWLLDHAGRIVGGMRLVKSGIAHGGAALWTVEIGK